ncbi:MAG: hypothetical protein L0271_11795 [Gemmatimonadetes bacterium]|nr:hypothetical protein [Gemmatimonadota bacterium]
MVPPVDDLVRTALAAAFAVVTGCGPGDAKATNEPSGTARSVDVPAVPVAGTPPGGLRDWVAAIRSGTAPLADDAVHDRAAAQRAALNLYIGRQEYLELYYGTAGREPHSETLGMAVMEAEARFHTLLQLLSVEPVDAAAVRAGVAALHDRLDAVVREADAAGVPEVLPGNVPAEGES